ncbi:MAG: acyl-CoA dehydrogenase [Candidatus Berkiella sp.]
MSTILWLIAWAGVLIALPYHRLSLLTSTVAIAAGLILTSAFSGLSWLPLIVLWGAFLGAAVFLHHPDLKRRFITLPIYKTLSRSLPNLSETEKAALDAGTVGFEGELFRGNPKWENLFKIPKPCLSEEEQAFINGPVQTVCEMVNDWETTHVNHDLAPEVWAYLKNEGFFGLMIPKKYGGKAFSALAHSEILTILAGRSIVLASTVSVPNSLGPAELIHLYGTDEQKNYYLPRLAKGQEIPCFALTGPDAGSDATAIPDTGMICQGRFDGKEMIGIKLNWNKRYITLAPVATLLGLAFKLYDPNHLLSEKEELGITCCLIPTHLPGIKIGRRHFPINVPFQNGPTQGQDVFIPLDYIIGGIDMAGQGWRMLVECLSVGRAISLPASSAGGAKTGSMVTSAYSVIRRQFKTPIANFEGVQEALARIGGFTYLMDSARYLTVAMIDQGEKPSVPGAITKYHVTELGRKVANDTMDIHGGKGIMMGPSNYLGTPYSSVPVGITVEGANILTRSMIIFGQGAIRCHPYIIRQVEALQQENIEEFESLLNKHIGYTLSNMSRAFFHGITFARFASSPDAKPKIKRYYQRLARASSAFALIADLSMALIGGKLKFKESLSGRLGDLLSMMYMMSATLKRYKDQQYPKDDFAFVQWSLDYCLSRYWDTMDDILRNFPNKRVAILLKLLIMPFGHACRPPSDDLNKKVVKLMTTLSESRSRLIGKVFISSNPEDSVRIVEDAFKAAHTHQHLIKKVYDSIKNQNVVQSTFEFCIEYAFNAKILSEEEAFQLRELNELVQKAIAVDDFSAEELQGLGFNREEFEEPPRLKVSVLNPSTQKIRS